jgi:hypothetical protein
MKSIYDVYTIISRNILNLFYVGSLLPLLFMKPLYSFVNVLEYSSPRRKL